MALSGGGIRSATFNLGLLQGLHDLGILGCFDYLATVSGGGYVGGFWSAWRSRAEDPNARAALFPRQEDSKSPEPGAIRRLREFSNFLSPRLGLLSVDTGRLVTAVLAAVIPSLLTVLSLILLTIAAWGTLSWLLLGPPSANAIPWLSLSTLCVLSAGVLSGLEWIWRLHETGVRRTPYVLSCLLAVVVACSGWACFKPSGMAVFTAPGWQLPAFKGAAWGSKVYLFAPALAWLGTVAVLVVLRWMASRGAQPVVPPTKHDRGMNLRQLTLAMDRVISRLLLMAGVWSAFVLLMYVAGLLASNTLPNPFKAKDDLARATYLSVTGFLSALFARAVNRLAQQQPQQAGQDGPLRDRMNLRMVRILAPVVVFLLMAGCGAVLSAMPADHHHRVIFGAAGMLLFSLLLFAPNQVGLHSFYRSRIVRAFLGASWIRGAQTGQRLTEEQDDDDLPLDALGKVQRPFHLICCAANDLNPSNPIGSLHRWADSAVLSGVAFSVGKTWAPWGEEKAPSLGSALTASGAALNAHMGAMSRRLGPAVTFLLTTLNVRLGLWLARPRPPDSSGAPLWRKVLVGWPFVQELVGASRSEGQEVLLSDGGHFENLGLYELIRRRCRYIVVSDCGMDPTVAFEDFGNAVRRVREDFGVQIEIDLSPLRPGAGGCARQPMVAGDLRYPDGTSGVLLLFKPSLVGTEPPDITQYKTANPAFPHDTTINQFYDEAQWESYRRLGAHAAFSAFQILGAEELVREMPETKVDVSPWAPELFARARREWLPLPSGFDSRLERNAKRMLEVEEMLQQPGCDGLRAEVFKELVPLEQALPTPPVNHGAALPVLRQALRLMEELFVSEDLARHYNHPLYLGVLNYFSRWAYAPLFRMWWPVLQTLHPRQFARFMESRFGLPSGMALSEAGAERISHGGDGFAKHCWDLDAGHRQAEVGGARHLLSYELDLRYGNTPCSTLQVAQVVVKKEGPRLSWDACDFYVPPGLWGVGLGERFLRKLLVNSATLFTEPVTSFRVRICTKRGASAAARKASADEAQLYLAAGFREVSTAKVVDAKAAPADEELQVLLEWSPELQPAEVPLQQAA
ncbi:hypothetical protein [Corallococcus carmarthensis]|uniref:hypothetical protein n=1 Tax=Corallococcus carmarthensis TaxID=2316728 RepID=UPI001ABFAC44|nr:hypothetical protein [Corallococcus carmarthensis]